MEGEQREKSVLLNYIYNWLSCKYNFNLIQHNKIV